MTGHLVRWWEVDGEEIRSCVSLRARLFHCYQLVRGSTRQYQLSGLRVAEPVRRRGTHSSTPSPEILGRSRTELDLLHPFNQGHIQVIPILSDRRQEEDQSSARDKHVSSEYDQIVHKVHHLVWFRYGLIARHAVGRIAG